MTTYRHYGRQKRCLDYMRSLRALRLFFVLLCTQSICKDDMANAEVIESAGTFTAFGPGQSSYSYRAEIVYFDDTDDSLRLPPFNRLVSNLMLPPGNYSSLCQYPTDAVEEYASAWRSANLFLNHTRHADDSNGLPVVYKYAPITLLVSMEGCDLMQKIKVALQIKQDITDDLWSILFYNNDTIHGDNWIVPLELPPGTNSTTVPGLDGLILTAVSRSSGEMIMNQIDRVINYAAYGGTIVSPVLLTGTGNDQWRLPLNLERGDDPFSNGDANNAGEDDSWTQMGFIWFRFIVFGFIFCLPCIRALRIWYVMGGRILLNRNENGRIIGFTIQPARATWHDIANPAGQGYESRIQARLTKEEVIELLPEISYTAPPFDKDYVVDQEGEAPSSGTDISDTQIALGSDDAHCKKNGDSAQSDQTTNQESSAQDETSAMTEAPNARNDQESATTNTESTANGPINHDEETANEEDQLRQRVDDNSFAYATMKKNGLFTATISTACSICIDEFEEGENIRLLPKCGHGYHTDCILPWLTERQGCCPLCKTIVLDKDVNVGRNDVERAERDESREENGISVAADQPPSIQDEPNESR